MMKNLRWNCYRIYVDPTRKLLPDTAAARCSRWQLSPLLPERTSQGVIYKRLGSTRMSYIRGCATKSYYATCLWYDLLKAQHGQLISSLIFTRKSMSSHFENLTAQGTQRAFWGLPQEFSSTKVLEIFSCPLRGPSSDSGGFKATKHDLIMMSLLDWSAKAPRFHCFLFGRKGAQLKNCSQFHLLNSLCSSCIYLWPCSSTLSAS